MQSSYNTEKCTRQGDVRAVRGVDLTATAAMTTSWTSTALNAQDARRPTAAPTATMEILARLPSSKIHGVFSHRVGYYEILPDGVPNAAVHGACTPALRGTAPAAAATAIPRGLEEHGITTRPFEFRKPD